MLTGVSMRPRARRACRVLGSRQHLQLAPAWHLLGLRHHQSPDLFARMARLKPSASSSRASRAASASRSARVSSRRRCSSWYSTSRRCQKLSAKICAAVFVGGVSSAACVDRATEAGRARQEQEEGDQEGGHGMEMASLGAAIRVGGSGSITRALSLRPLAMRSMMLAGSETHVPNPASSCSCTCTRLRWALRSRALFEGLAYPGRGF
jgi:hypothetical protein